ncbi:MAG: saccharopine dehydrogenase [Calditrichaeota bacterium]|nr:MAG: saccharopine dehydrogenase [Calditrichota bacterium]
MKIVVLGAGLVGGPMAVDLAKEKQFEVTIVDRDAQALAKIAHNQNLHTVTQDLANPVNVSALVNNFDFVVNAVPGFMGFRTFEAVIKAGKNIVDIAFFPEDPFQMKKLAEEMGVIAIMDCGVAPGMSNILVAHAATQMDTAAEATIFVGGLPQVRTWPWEYQAVFSPIDVIEEYTRPARLVENGEVVVKEALTELELLDFPGVGTLEAFNSDGLRTLVDTMSIPNMKEKTLRYPGHVERVRLLRHTGFFSQEAVEINGSMIRPIDLTAKLLFPQWEMRKDDRDITIMQVQVIGMKDGKKISHTFDLLDHFDTATSTRSMARTTGYTATVVTRMLAQGVYKQSGLTVPEHIGKDAKAVAFLLNGLAKRGVHYKETVRESA